MDIAVGILRTSIEAFDKSAQQLLDLLSYDAETYGKFEKFINGCRYACTANLNWRLVVKSFLSNLHRYADA